MVSKWESLPTELLQMVCDCGCYKNGDTTDLTELTKVCRAWRHIYQKVLYRTVRLKGLPHISKFLLALKVNSHLGSLVEDISFVVRTKYNNSTFKPTFATLFTLLPNLKRVGFRRSSGYDFLLDALKLNKLPYLNHVEPAIRRKDKAPYTACVMILKKRLKNLKLVNVHAYEQQEYEIEDQRSILFHSIFDKLDEFDKITDLFISKKSNNNIDLLEKVTKSCPLLKKVELEFTCYLGGEDSSNINMVGVIPASKVSKLVFSGGVNYDSTFTAYLATKFPKLNMLVITGQSDRIGHLNEFQLESYLHYLSSIPNVTVDEIPVQNQALVSSLGPFWGVMAKSRKLSVKITYGGEALEDVYPVNADISVVSFHIDRSRISNSILYSPLANSSNQADIIVNHGRYIDCLKIFDAPDHLSGHPLYECIMFQPLKYCTRLNRFYAVRQGYRLYFEVDLILSKQGRVRKRTASSIVLSIDRINTFRDLFKNIYRIESLHCYLELSGTGQYNDLCMATTDIGSATFNIELDFFDMDLVGEEEVILVKLKRQRNYSYFVYDTETFVFDRVESDFFEDFQNNSEHLIFMLDLNFKSIKNITIEFGDRNLHIPFNLLS